jgi:hypothetical protein
MKKISEKNFMVEGNLYTDMYIDPRLLTTNPDANKIYVKGDVHFGILSSPKKMRELDYYMDYEKFLKEHGEIFDIFPFCK